MTGIDTLVAAATPARPPERPNRLLRAGLVAGPLFVLTFLIEPALHPGYDPIRHPVSSLALGPAGWVQVVNFVVAGVLSLLFAAGLRRALRPGPGARAVPIAVALWGVGLLGAGIFTADPVSGYPPGTPATPAAATIHGRLHDLAFSLPMFAALAVAMLALAYAYARRNTLGWAAYSALSAVAFVALMATAVAGFAQQSPVVEVAGLLQRLALTTGWVWFALVAGHEIRRASAAAVRRS
ncbi:DUF998 domain-containing protein [Dactylosporangium vinaceum]|uniref:DUF998 domain-containing protein n=1 Tax=Dactylosporangium vinaceum TaxID=53362 RepID=A0ABV5MRZ2_9ACTN|nr:DUF998 domain-containing protein [Dactylosporangium vinaceum]UAC00344.1 DUF998 domain-containing protein [Dactylosporangium vinaceum]